MRLLRPMGTGADIYSVPQLIFALFHHWNNLGQSSILLFACSIK